MKREAGFTLIEVIAVLLLVAVLGAVAGMGLVTGVEGYIFARENAPTSQKAQVALARLRRELMEMSSISFITPSSIIYGQIEGSRAIGLVGGDKIKIREGAELPDEVTGDILIENIGSFILTCFNDDGELWDLSQDIRELTTIKIDLVLNRADSGVGTISFSTSVNPRNTGNLNSPADL